MVRPPIGSYLRVAALSELSTHFSIDVGGGVIDPDFRGNLGMFFKMYLLIIYIFLLGVILFNHGDAAFDVKKGDRIAQMICQVFRSPEIEEVDAVTMRSLPSDRGEHGFGSTGVTDIPSPPGLPAPAPVPEQPPSSPA